MDNHLGSEIWKLRNRGNVVWGGREERKGKDGGNNEMIVRWTQERNGRKRYLTIE